MGRALIIGCGGVAGVVIHKCCQNSDVFEEIMIASRTKSKCDAIKEKLDGTTATKIRTAKVDADNVDELCALIDEYKPDIVMNIALPYQDLTIMDACLKCGVNYMDTANYEPEDTDDPEWRAIYEKRCKDEGFTAYFDYSWQWAYKKKFEDVDGVDFIEQMLLCVSAVRLRYARVKAGAEQSGQTGLLELLLVRPLPRGMLPRGRLAGHQLHHRRSGDDRRGDAADRQVEQAGRVHRRGVRSRSVHGGAEQVGSAVAD